MKQPTEKNMILPILAEMTGSIHVGLAALGAAIGVGLDRHGRGLGGRPQSRRGHSDSGAGDSGHRARGSDRVLRLLPRLIGDGAQTCRRPAYQYEHRNSCCGRPGRHGPGNRGNLRFRYQDFPLAGHQLRHRRAGPAPVRLQADPGGARRAPAADRRRPPERGEDQAATRGSGAAPCRDPGQGERPGAKDDR